MQKEIPKIHNGMRFVKAYSNHVLYENDYYKESFQYYDLDIIKVYRKRIEPRLSRFGLRIM